MGVDHAVLTSLHSKHSLPFAGLNTFMMSVRKVDMLIHKVLNVQPDTELQNYY